MMSNSKFSKETKEKKKKQKNLTYQGRQTGSPQQPGTETWDNSGLLTFPRFPSRINMVLYPCYGWLKTVWYIN